MKKLILILAVSLTLFTACKKEKDKIYYEGEFFRNENEFYSVADKKLITDSSVLINGYRIDVDKKGSIHKITHDAIEEFWADGEREYLIDHELTPTVYTYFNTNKIKNSFDEDVIQVKHGNSKLAIYIPSNEQISFGVRDGKIENIVLHYDEEYVVELVLDSDGNLRSNNMPGFTLMEVDETVSEESWEHIPEFLFPNYVLIDKSFLTKHKTPQDLAKDLFNNGSNAIFNGKIKFIKK